MNANEAAEAKAKLRAWLKPGDTVYTILRHVSRSGMQRHISVVLIRPDGTILHPNHATAAAIGARLNKPGTGYDAVIRSGCGMDMGYDTVYNLSAALFPQGFGCIGEGCPSNDHSNGDRDYTPHNAALVAELQAAGVGIDLGANHWHKDGGYALRHRWL
jgi:hypothetical protein